MSEESEKYPGMTYVVSKEFNEQYAGVLGKIDKHTIALEELANKVVNLANKLDEHLNERDAHNPGTMRAK